MIKAKLNGAIVSVWLISAVMTVLSLHAQVSSGVGIGSIPDNSAMLDVSDSSRGVLFPRLTIAQRNAIQNPAFGLVIFNSDCGVFNFNSGTPVNPVWETISSSNVLTPSVTIASLTPGFICAGNAASYAASPGVGLGGVSFQWKVNGLPQGNDTSVFTSSSLINGDIVECEITTSAPCAVGTFAVSNALLVTTSTLPAAPLLITGASTECLNSTANGYSVAFQPSVSSYTWSVPVGASITSGQGTNSVLVDFGTTSGDIEVVVSNSCGSSSPVQLPVTLLSIPNTPGAITGATSPLEFATSIAYSISSVPDASSYQWTVPSGATITSGQGTNSILVTFGNTSGTIGVTASNSCGVSSSTSLQVTLATGGQVLYDTPGTYSWTCPPGVTSVCVVAIGGGAGGGTGNYGAGAGGGLGWKNNISVVPGQNYTVQVGSGGAPGAAGGNSFFINASTVSGNGGLSSGGSNPSNTTPLGGGGFVGDGGGAGGGYMGTNGGGAISGGGGGAGGYTGTGGRGGGNTGTSYPATAGQGGGGGGGAGINSGGTNHGGGGGGTGVLGAGADGAAGQNQTNLGGGGGSGGQAGFNGLSTGGGAGGTYGGGGAGRNGGSGSGGAGAVGAVRIIWGPNRAFPSTNTQNL